jgi:hypothetical protein
MISSFITVLCILLLSTAGCSDRDPSLPRLSREAFSRRSWAQPLPPAPFESDGCSWWPDREWIECCVAHDALYWMGGSGEERKRADNALRQCVTDKGYPILGEIMFYGVRAWGVHWLPTPFRWGFGWRFPHAGPPRAAPIPNPP